MRSGPLDYVLALLIAAGFAAVGETVLRRASASLAQWNSSLVAGMGACAALLFPLSLVAGRRALDLTLGLMGLCAATTVWRRLRRREASAGGSEVARAAWLPLAIAALAAAAFAVLDWRYNLLWDGFAAWASKAQRLFVEGGLTRTWYPGDSYDSRYVSYPPLVPLYEALVSRLHGRFDFGGLKPVFLVFYVSMAGSVYAAVRARASARLAAWAVALVLFVPALSTRWAAGAYADMPQAAVVAAVVAAAMRSDAAALPWLLGALTTVKPEGMILALIAAVAIAAATRLRGIRLGAVAAVAAFVAVRVAYLRWTGVREDTYLFRSVGFAIERAPEVARLCLRELLDPSAWGLLWPAFLAAAVVGWRMGDAKQRSLAAAVAAGILAMAAPFLFTTWPLELHVSQAYFRLLAQLAPAAVVAAVLAWGRAWERWALPPPAA